MFMLVMFVFRSSLKRATDCEPEMDLELADLSRDTLYTGLNHKKIKTNHRNGAHLDILPLVSNDLDFDHSKS